MREPLFVNLNLHSTHSYGRSLLEIKQIIETAFERGEPAIGLTDEETLKGAKEFIELCIKYGIKPVIGCEIAVSPSAVTEPNRLILICQNKEGYKNIQNILSFRPPHNKNILNKFSKGLIAISPFCEGDISEPKDEDEIIISACDYIEIYGENVYLGLDLPFIKADKKKQEDFLYNTELMPLKLVVINDVRFLKKEDYKVFLNLLKQKQNREIKINRYIPSEDSYFQTEEEIVYPFLEYPQALLKSTEIAENIEEFEVG